MSVSRVLTAVLAVACVVVAASCSRSPAASPFRPPAVVRSSTPWAASDGPRPILIDTDLDVDDLVAIAILAGDPAVDVLAVTVTGTGIVHCDPGVDLAARWLAALGRADVPVACGPETAGPGGRSFPSEWRARADAGFGLRLPALARATDHVSARALIGAAVEKAHGDLVVVAIGPWTNLADAIRTDASVAARIGAVHAMIGAIDVPGNVEMGGHVGEGRG